MIIEAEVRGGVIWVAAQLGTVASSITPLTPLISVFLLQSRGMSTAVRETLWRGDPSTAAAGAGRGTGLGRLAGRPRGFPGG